MNIIVYKVVLRTLGLIGCIVFIPLFLITFSSPYAIEKSALSFIEWKLKSKVESKIDSLNLNPTSQLGTALNNKLETQIQALKQQLKDDLPKLLSKQIGEVQNPDCECRRHWEKRIATSIQLEIGKLEAVKERLGDFVKAQYMEIVTNLKNDLRIFLGTNSIVFLFFLLTSFTRPQAIRHLFLPGILLFISTIFSSYLYIFNQNWIFTIIYNNYTGFAYTGYLTLCFSILCDIAFNRARITSYILNMVLSAIGRTTDFIPC